MTSLSNRPKIRYTAYMSTKLLFVCSGNICRSPMALGIARHKAQNQGIDIEVDSAGTLMIEGRSADDHAITVCGDIGVDIQAHRSKGLKETHCEWADHILIMEPKHSQFIQAHFPQHRDKVIHMGHLIGNV